MVGLKKLLIKILNQIPFGFGIDSNGNYGYIKRGADSVTPFKQIKSGTSTMSGYGTWTTVNLGFKPRAVAGYCRTGTGPYLMLWFYLEGITNQWVIRSGATKTNANDKIKILNNGFQWYSVDSTGGSQTINYIAIR